MDGDFGTYVKYFLSILVGVCCVGGSVVFFNYDKFEDPRKRRKQFIIGLSMVALGFGVSIGYHQARKDNKLPGFLTKSEDQKKADKQLEKEKAEQEARNKEKDSSQAEKTADKLDDKVIDGDATGGVKKAAEPVVQAKPGEKVFAVKHLASPAEEEVSEPSPDNEMTAEDKKK